jgi:ATP-dependent Lon protease
MSEETTSVVEKEISRISAVSLESENSKRIEYINHILSLPWDNFNAPIWDIDYAKKVLDSQLFGLNTTKERIYEFIAKNLRNKHAKGCVVLLTGGPGTGKIKPLTLNR